jgi:hypothetical protein
MGPGYTSMATGLGAGVGSQIATNALKNAGQKAGGSALTGGASSAGSWTSGAAGMGAGIGIGMAGDWAAGKLKPKEEMPIYGSRHADILDHRGRRFEGAGPGVAGGAVKGASMGANPALAGATGGLSIVGGALIGGIAGAATKNATSAFSDFSANDAYDSIGQAYKNYLGRDATHEEIMGRLVGQGYNADKGHEYVGEKGLRYHLDEIEDSAEAQAFRARSAGAPADTPPAGTAPAAPVTLPEPPQSSLASGRSASGETLPRTTAVPSTPQGQQAPTNTPTATRPGQSSASFNSNGFVAGRPDVVTPDDLRNPTPGTAPKLELSEPGAPAPPAADNSGWNTDGYAKPAFTAQAGGGPLAGWDATKWADVNHQTPKYVWGRIAASNMGPEGLNVPKAVDELIQAYPGATFNGKDKVTIPGIGTIDLLGGASIGQNTPQWLDEANQGGAPVGDMSFAGPGPESFNVPPPIGGSNQSYDRVMQYLMQQMGLDRAASGIAG